MHVSNSAVDNEPAPGQSLAAQADLRLGYVGIEARDLDAWERFGRTIGFHVERAHGLLTFRLDEHERRFIIWQGPRDDVACIGWEADDETALQAARARLRAIDVDTQDIGGKGLQLRAVSSAFRFAGPLGLPFEIYSAATLATRPLQLNGLSGFVAGSTGIGHVAVMTKDIANTRRTLEAMLKTRHTDDIHASLQGIEVELTFLRLNRRHHSIALAGLKGVEAPPWPTTVAHIMVEVARLEDVGAAFVRCRSEGYRFGMDVGKHSNDKATSFYVVTPSRFELEVGWGPVVITDEAAWEPASYDCLSLWGHRPDE